VSAVTELSNRVTVPARSRAHGQIPLRRITLVEFRKMHDTRSGFWLMCSIAILAVLATGAVLIWAPEDDIKYSTFATAIGFPMVVILPIIAVLSVTSEWSQRSGLTTFTLVPHRSRILLAKGLATIGVAIGSMVLAMTIGAVGNVGGATIKGATIVWDMNVRELLFIVVGNILGLLFGFMLGTLIRNSAGAIVAYFVNTFVLGTLLETLAANASWFRNARPWVDFGYAQNALFDDTMTGEATAQLLVTGAIWLVAPLTLGTWLLLRSEVK
jgi:ABC-2 type transport system permease protein